MKPGTRPTSLDGRWDILYRDYPQVYDEFGRIPKEPDLLETIMSRFPLRGKWVVDVGSGGGISSFKMARQARLGHITVIAMVEHASC